MTEGQTPLWLRRTVLAGLLGGLGGLAAFGLIGLFVGPVILAILLALWREWDGLNAAPAPTASKH